jgi:hypothetical protein
MTWLMQTRAILRCLIKVCFAATTLSLHCPPCKPHCFALPATACPLRGGGVGPSSCSCVQEAGPSPSSPLKDHSSLVTPAVDNKAQLAWGGFTDGLQPSKASLHCTNSEATNHRRTSEPAFPGRRGRCSSGRGGEAQQASLRSKTPCSARQDHSSAVLSVDPLTMHTKQPASTSATTCRQTARQQHCPTLFLKGSYTEHCCPLTSPSQTAKRHPGAGSWSQRPPPPAACCPPQRT